MTFPNIKNRICNGISYTKYSHSKWMLKLTYMLLSTTTNFMSFINISYNILFVLTILRYLNTWLENSNKMHTYTHTFCVIHPIVKHHIKTDVLPQQIILVPSKYATCFSHTDNHQALGYITLKLKIKLYIYIILFWVLKSCIQVPDDGQYNRNM